MTNLLLYAEMVGGDVSEVDGLVALCGIYQEMAGVEVSGWRRQTGCCELKWLEVGP